MLAALVTIVLVSSLASLPIASASKVADYNRTDVIIGFHGAPDQSLVKNAGGKVKQVYSIINAIAANLPEQAIGNLRGNSKVSYIEADVIKEYSAQTLPWGVDRIDAEAIWDNNTDGLVDPSANAGQGVKVAVLDTGGDQNHQDLNFAGGTSVVSKDPSKWGDKNGHGTHVSGTIAALANTDGVVGVGPQIDLYIVQISRGPRLSTSNIVAGIEWANANGMQVMSMSLGGGFSRAEADALQVASNNGIILVAAVGNDGRNSVDYPAALSTVIAVGATTSTDALASFSNFGSEVEILAPGASILSTYKDGGYATLSGTSMSTPHVAAVAALVLANTPALTAGQVRSLIITTGDDIGSVAPLLDAEDAVLGTEYGDDLVGGAPPPPPPPPTPGNAVVEDISFSTKTKGRFVDLITTVSVVDENGSPINGFRVEMTLTQTDGTGSWNFAGDTNSNGEVKFKLQRIPQDGVTRNFSAQVTNIADDGIDPDETLACVEQTNGNVTEVSC